MNRICMHPAVIVALFACAAVPASGQDRAEPESAARPLDNRVDTLLRDWSERTAKITGLYTEFTRATLDTVWRSNESAEGSARYLHPDRARLDVYEVESYVLTGDGEIWEYKVPLKQITIFELPGDEGTDAFEEGPLPFLFGTKPDKAKARYRFEIIGEDDATIQIQILPKLRDDQRNFVVAELTLDKRKLLPTRLFFREVNGNEVTYTFKTMHTNLDTDLKIDPADFVGKRVRGWRVVRQTVSEEPAVQSTAGKPSPTESRQ